MSQRDIPDETKSSEPTLESVDPALPTSSENDKYEYQCPYCDESYQHELLTRVHVTRSDDASHLNQNGMMPEVEIEIVDADGELVETVARRPEEIDPSKLTIDSFPDEISSQHKHILLVAAKNAEESTYSTLAQKVEDRLDDYDIETPSYSTIRRVIRQFYRSRSETESSGQDTNKDSLSALTAKQQAIIIARLISPNASTNDISDQIGCANSYPSQVFQLAESIISDLEEQIDQGADPRTLIRNELGEEDIHELVGRDLLANIPIHFPSVTDSEDDNTADWGSPVGHKGGMTAAPNDFDQQTQDTDSGIAEQTKLTKKSNTDSDTKTTEDNLKGKPSSKKSTKTIPREEIEELKEKVQFLRRVFSHSEVEEDGTQVLVSFSRQIEGCCEDILDEFSGAE